MKASIKIVFVAVGLILFVLGALIVIKTSLNIMDKKNQTRILFLHHSTGDRILTGGRKNIRYIRKFFKQKSFVSNWINRYNKDNHTNYIFEDQYFPKRELYGWNNYPFDYYNIWVKHAGEKPYKNEPTLEILTKKYNLIIFKHCFPVSNILEDTNEPDINSAEKKLENYKLQYLAIRQKLLQFPNTKFLLWTGAAQVKNNTTEEEAGRANMFFSWVRDEWDLPGDNIFLWDFYNLETEDSHYLKPEYATSESDSHPNRSFSRNASLLFCKRIIEVVEQNR